MRDRITTILEHWFIQEPALFQVLCTHELVSNTQMACPVRSGKRRVEYNPDYLREMTDPGLEEALRTEAIRIFLKHPYERKPDGCSQQAIAVGSNVVVGDNYKYNSFRIEKPSDYGLPAGMAYEWYSRKIQAMLPKLDSILMNVNLLLADPALKNSLHHIDQITGNLTTTTNELNTMAQTLNRQMPSLIKNADGMLANANDLTRNLNELDLAATMAKVNNTLQNVEQMTAKLNSNEGTLGLLMRDAELYNNMNATMMHADSLMIDLKAHPKRYVHFSIFGKKDK